MLAPLLWPAAGVFGLPIGYLLKAIATSVATGYILTY
jgi:hypothetical protein